MSEESRTAVITLLALSRRAMTAPQIRKDLAGSFRISVKETTALLDSMAAQGEIFAWPGKRYWARSPREEANRLILEFLAGSPAVTAVKIRSGVKFPLDIIIPALDQLVAESRVYVWQPGKAAMYCLFEPRSAVQESIRKTLEIETLDEKGLVGRIRGRLPGYTAGLLRDHLQPLLRSGEILKHPKYGKAKVRYGLKPPDPGDYLDRAAAEVNAVHKVLAPSGVSLNEVFHALSRRLGVSAETTATISREKAEGKAISAESEDLILQGIHRLQPPGQHRALVPIRELRRSLGLAKNDFDTAVFSLALKRRVALHHHDFPSSLSREEREELVRDDQGTYYVGIVPKEA